MSRTSNQRQHLLSTSQLSPNSSSSSNSNIHRSSSHSHSNSSHSSSNLRLHQVHQILYSRQPPRTTSRSTMLRISTCSRRHLKETQTSSPSSRPTTRSSSSNSWHNRCHARVRASNPSITSPSGSTLASSQTRRTVKPYRKIKMRATKFPNEHVATCTSFSYALQIFILLPISY